MRRADGTGWDGAGWAGLGGRPEGEMSLGALMQIFRRVEEWTWLIDGDDW